MDKASSSKGSGAEVILEKEGEIVVELSIKFYFLVSNNQVKYKALIAGLKLANDIGASGLMICSDSQIGTSQINRTYQAKIYYFRSTSRRGRI